MKISINGEELFSLTETQKKVIKHDIHEDIFEEDMKRRIKWALMHKYEQCLARLKSEYMPKLIEVGAKTIPTDADELAEMIFKHPEYKSRKERDLETV